MTNSLFNAELRDCARVNEIAEQREVSRDEQVGLIPHWELEP
jgi:hypothetical protein